MSDSKSIGIIVFDGVLTSEVIGPAEVFAIASEQETAGEMTVRLIGIEDQPTIRTEEGLRIAVDATIEDNLTLDVLIVPGGNDVSHLLQHEKLSAFIQQQEEYAQWLGSVCAGAFVLGSAGALDGKQATTWYGGEASLQAQFPQIEVVEDSPVVVDNRRITANGGLVSYRAALILLGKMLGIDTARAVYRKLSIERLGTWADIEAELSS